MDILELEKIASMPSPEEARVQLKQIREKEATQAAISRANEAIETYTARFEASLTEVQARRVELDNELRQIKEMLVTYIQKRQAAILLANEAAKLAKWLAGAKIRAQYPSGAEDWRIEGLGEQIVMDLNNGKKQLMFLTQSLDDTVFNNLVATIANETNEVIVKPAIQPAMPIVETSYQPGRTR